MRAVGLLYVCPRHKQGRSKEKEGRIGSVYLENWAGEFWAGENFLGLSSAGGSTWLPLYPLLSLPHKRRRNTLLPRPTFLVRLFHLFLFSSKGCLLMITSQYDISHGNKHRCSKIIQHDDFTHSPARPSFILLAVAIVDMYAHTDPSHILASFNCSLLSMLLSLLLLFGHRRMRLALSSLYLFSKLAARLHGDGLFLIHKACFNSLNAHTQTPTYMHSPLNHVYLSCFLRSDFFISFRICLPSPPRLRTARIYFSASSEHFLR